MTFCLEASALFFRQGSVRTAPGGKWGGVVKYGMIQHDIFNLGFSGVTGLSLFVDRFSILKPSLIRPSLNPKMNFFGGQYRFATLTDPKLMIF